MAQVELLLSASLYRMMFFAEGLSTSRIMLELAPK